jgi:hypothetical protein
MELRDAGCSTSRAPAPGPNRVQLLCASHAAARPPMRSAASAPHAPAPEPLQPRDRPRARATPARPRAAWSHLPPLACRAHAWPQTCAPLEPRLSLEPPAPPSHRAARHALAPHSRLRSPAALRFHAVAPSEPLAPTRQSARVRSVLGPPAHLSRSRTARAPAPAAARMRSLRPSLRATSAPPAAQCLHSRACSRFRPAHARHQPRAAATPARLLRAARMPLVEGRERDGRVDEVGGRGEGNAAARGRRKPNRR